ncbi:hypothetical protein C6P41_002042 [Kluyveromyces marxianus]|nr:hypothetical protein C6P43_002334 [Kluyveromyces marxianus]KAG0684742.1 hypothetical protein C6P41_002042 [Kluyveromyces marxianus]
MSISTQSASGFLDKVPSSLVVYTAVMFYLLSGGRISVSLAVVVGFFILRKHNEEVSSAKVEEVEPPKKKGCCGGKNGGCSGHKVDDNGLPIKKKSCCGGACKSKKVEDPAPAVEISYDNEIDFTDSFKR